MEGKVDATLLWSDFHREDYAVSNIGKVYPHYKNGNGSGSGEGGGVYLFMLFSLLWS